jgi:hypothetical protein
MKNKNKHKKKKGTNPQLDRVAADVMNPATGLFDSIVASARHYTVGFIGLPDSTLSGSPKPCGTATLVRVGTVHYFLTADHVWTVLRGFKKIGITLVPNIDQCFSISTADLTRTGPRRPTNERSGPDIVLLKIPSDKLGEVKARKSFYPLDKTLPKAGLPQQCLEVRVLLGAPEETAQLTTPMNLDLTIQGMMADPIPKAFTRGRFDYFDSREIAGQYGFPSTYRGFSGGGVWHIYLFDDPKTGKRDWKFALEGMAFYEFPIAKSHRRIRCHGPRSLQIVRRMLRQRRTVPTSLNGSTGAA